MDSCYEYRLRIDVFSVESLPMARLAEYMGDLARLLGEQERVHFARLEKGSAVLVSSIELQAAPKVRERLGRIGDGKAPKDVMQAFAALDNLLAKDNAVATLTTADGAEIIAFPGRTRPKPIRYGPFREYGSLDGMVIRVGGRGETIPVLIKDTEGAEFGCQTTVEQSMKLSAYYRRGTVRVHGSGKWLREEDGSWKLEEFDIDRFEVLDDSPLLDVITQLRAVDGGEWSTDKAMGDIVSLRREEGPTH